MSRQTRVIINADDLGLARGINRGIGEVLASGSVRSTSLMVNMPATPDALEQLARARDRVGMGGMGGDLSVGLHFNIVTGAPLTGGGTLRDPRSGAFRPLLAQLWRAWLDRLDPTDVNAELEAQLERAAGLLAPLGMRVTHIDSHRHTHALPGIAEVVHEAARRWNIAHVRHAFESGATLLDRPSAHLKARALRVALSTGIRRDDVRFAGIALMASQTFGQDILRLADALEPGTTELMVHPGYDCPELAALDSYRAARERELRALTSPSLAAALSARGVELSCFGALATARPA